ncbi:MAG: tetratricopeptide repeat protein [Cytophagales bacterium]|nr:tetratricopeptide repeat protein [Cytophagales bacterium]
MKGWTLIWILCLLCGRFSNGQGTTTLSAQLHEINQLINDKDTMALHRLEQLRESAMVAPDSITIRYHQLKGNYYLSADQFQLAVEGYQPLLNFNHLDQSRSSSSNLARGINDMGIALMRIGAFDRAKKAHHQSLDIYDYLNDPQGAAFNYNNLAVLFQSLKQKDSALHHFSKSLEYAVIAKDSMGIAFNNQNLGILHGNMNDPVNAIKHFQEALLAFGKMNQTASVMYCIKGIGSEYNKIGDLDSARKYFTINYRYHQKNGSPRRKAGANSSMGELMGKLRKYDSAGYYYRSALKQYEAINYAYGMAKSHSLIGILLSEMQVYDSALFHLNRSLEFSSNFKGLSEASYTQLGNVYFTKSNYEKAIENAQQALAVSNGNATTGHLLLIYETLHKSYDRIGDLQNAHEYLKRYTDAKEEILGKERALDLARIETKMAHEKALNQEREENLKREFILEKRVLLERGLGMSAALFLSFLLFWVIRDYRVKGRRNLKLHEQNQIIESQKLQLERAANKERKLLGEQLQAKDRELAILAMQSNEKNEILKKLKEKLELKRGEQNTKEIKKLIESNLALDNSWDSFLTKFEDVYPQFFSKMKVEYEALSVNQLKLCAYIKVGMDNNEISKVTNTEMSSVKKNLNRLKKKLNLGPQDSIRTFVMNYA